MAAAPEDLIATALREAEQRGFDRGYNQAVADMGGSHSAATKVALLMADMMEQAALRFRDETDMSEQMRMHARTLRAATMPTRPPTVHTSDVAEEVASLPGPEAFGASDRGVG